MSFAKQKPRDPNNPENWSIGQARGKFLAWKEDFTERYDPLEVGEGRIRVFEEMFSEKKALELVDTLNKKSPLTEVSSNDSND